MSILLKYCAVGKKNNKEELFLIPFRFACTFYFDVSTADTWPESEMYTQLVLLVPSLSDYKYEFTVVSG